MDNPPTRVKGTRRRFLLTRRTPLTVPQVRAARAVNGGMRRPWGAPAKCLWIAVLVCSGSFVGYAVNPGICSGAMQTVWCRGVEARAQSKGLEANREPRESFYAASLKPKQENCVIEERGWDGLVGCGLEAR